MLSDNKTLNLYIALFLVLLLTGVCQNSYAKDEIIVSAAASLTGVMKKVKHSFEMDNPSMDLIFNFASSGSLLQQIRLGAPVDVFLSANTAFMDRAETEKLIISETRHNFAVGSLVLITPAASTQPVSEMNDTLSPSMGKIAIGNPKTVPAGRYAKTALIHAGLWEKIQGKLILANSVRQVLEYTVRSEVDAGFLYKTDAIKNRKVNIIQKIENTGPITYPVALTTGSKSVKQGQKFIDFLLSEKGQSILVSSGFNRFN